MDGSCRSVVLVGVLVGGLGALRPIDAAAAPRRSVVLEVGAAGAGGADWRAEALARTLTADLADDRLAPRPAPACGGPCSDAQLRAAGVELVVRATLAAGPVAVAYELRALWPGGPAPVRGAIALGGGDRVAFAGALRDQLHRLARASREDGADSEGREPEAPGQAANSERAGAATGTNNSSAPAGSAIAPASGSNSAVTPAAASDSPVGSAAGSGSAATPTGASGSAVAAGTGSGSAATAAAGSGANAASSAAVPPAATPPVVHKLPSAGDAALAALLAVAALAIPIAVGSARARRLVARRPARNTLAGVACLGGLGIALAAIEPANARGAAFAAGGVAWAAVAAVTLPIAFPPLVGMARTDYRELLRLFAGWAGLVVRRAIAVAVIYAPVVAGVALAGDAITGGDDALRLGLALPVALLIWRQWLRLAVAVAAERLDAALTDTTADTAAWQDAVRAYHVGYLRRNGLPVDGELLDRLVVLPALGDEVVVYGGGATHTRLAIPRRILELALAPVGRPHDYAAPRVSTLHWTEWNAGLVMASEPGSVVATREQRQPRATTAEGDPSEHAREPLGEPPTLIGIIEPRALDPRTGYRPHDDPAWLDWAGEEYDGTDAGDRDFLFGVLGHAVAQIQRHADRFATLAAVIARLGRGGRIGRVAAPIGRLIERASDAIADDHAALSGARHHLVQYLGWEVWQSQDEQLLTARADAPRLAATSRRLLARLDQPAARPGPAAARARARLARLAGLVGDTAAPASWWQRLALAGALLAGAGAAVLAVADAVRYHAVYTQRSTPRAITAPPETPHGQN